MPLISVTRFRSRSVLFLPFFARPAPLSESKHQDAAVQMLTMG